MDDLSPTPLLDLDLAPLPDDDPAIWSSRLRTGLATLAAEREDARAGLAVLETLLPDGPASGSLIERDLWARFLLRAGRIPEARACAEARQQAKDSHLPRMIMLEAHLAACDLEAAAEAARGIADIADPRSAAPAIARGRVALGREQPHEAATAFHEALAMRPDSIPALEGLANALARAGDTAAAAVALRDAVRICGADARPALLRRLAELVPDEQESLAAERTAALDALANRLRAELEAVRAAPRRSSRSHVAAAAPHSTSGRKVATHAGAELLAYAPVDADEVPPDELARTLFEHFGHAAFRPGQAAVLRSVLTDGKDTLAIMPTGAGKSLCFQLPALVLSSIVLVVSPLVALMADQIAGLAEVPALSDRATLINSTLAADQLEQRLLGVAAGAYSLVYVAPERLRHATMLRALKAAGVSLLVIDEAHCLSLWGHAFRPDYLAIGRVAETLGQPRLLAVTATATPAMQAEIAHTLNRRLAVVNTGVLRENLFLEVRVVANDRDKRTCLIDFVRGARGAGIVYANSRDRCEQLAETLRRRGERAAYYHAGLPSAEREAIQSDFMSGRVRVLVATVAFGMGVNKRDIRFIVHYQPARSLEAYTQEVGRAGRDGQPAHCLLLATPADKGTLTRRAHEDQVDVAALRDLYRRVRRALHEAGRAPIDWASLAGAGADRSNAEVDVRVGLSVLERAGLIARGLDAPRDVTVLLARPPIEPEIVAVARALQLSTGRARTVDMTVLAGALELPPDEVERVLGEWQDRGALQFATGRRGLVLRIVEPPPPDGAERIGTILATISAGASDRAQALVRYIEATHCRNAVIARHFGVAAEATCGRCDNCAPDSRRVATPDPVRVTTRPRVTGLSPREAILRLVAELPFAAGRRGLSRILAGAASSPIEPERCRLFGALAGRTQAHITEEIETLVEHGLLTTIAVRNVPCLALTEAGRAEVTSFRGMP